MVTETAVAPKPASAPDQGLSIELLERMLVEQPRDPNVWSALGSLLRQQGKVQQAIACQHRALEFDPEHSGAWTNLGNVLADQERYDEAIAAHEKAVTLSKGAFSHVVNYTVALRHARRFERAVQVIDHALKVAPGNVSLRWDRVLTLLQLGRYEEGFRDYDCRLDLPSYQNRKPPGVLWDGSPLDGRTILLNTEQGFGDALLTARYVPLVKARGGRVILECHPELRRLLDGLTGVDAFIPAGSELPPYDVYCPLMSLPERLGTTVDSVPPPTPVSVPADARAKAATLVPKTPGILNVGIIWSGRVTFKDNTRRATTLSRFLRFLEIPKVRLFSLQKGPPEAELETLGTTTLITPLGPHFQDFADTAAALERLDLIIMTDSSVAHLAGSLGRPVWNLLQYMPYWIYGDKGSTTPWYPSMRLFQQETPGDWDGVFADAGQALRQLAASQSTG
ncbi:tetratricopeptide repeat protein [Azospirillum doebereinerae]|uniref:tetratricopeptide repeat protein n=1 Tax=Azospirillum doebereinerae TaxID=92933 RepID=UPI001EE58660|nr:tetratricopeptide repeat-containing glycosyltransferase family protein [Azospirillum doebereinerae]MCG5238900.1 tetratricopeptide repeat-containing glycosyltransferase family protein [Azospirillum doebereinerae]